MNGPPSALRVLAYVTLSIDLGDHRADVGVDVVERPDNQRSTDHVRGSGGPLGTTRWLEVQDRNERVPTGD